MITQNTNKQLWDSLIITHDSEYTETTIMGDHHHRLLLQGEINLTHSENKGGFNYSINYNESDILSFQHVLKETTLPILREIYAIIQEELEDDSEDDSEEEKMDRRQEGP